MAAITVNSLRSNYNGAYREDYYDVSGASGTTLDTKMRNIVDIKWDDHANVTDITASAGTLTFTGTMTNTLVRVTGS